MPRPRKRLNSKLKQAEIDSELSRLAEELIPPRPWMKTCRRDQVLVAALRRRLSSLQRSN
jgi:hypothetical protein